jgi:hypothetical protein
MENKNNVARISVRAYPESVYPVEKWVYRYEGLDGAIRTEWLNGGKFPRRCKEESR